LRDDVEWSFNIESEFFVEFSLLWLFWIFVNVDDVPLLVKTSILVGNSIVLVFSIKVTLYFNDFTSFISDVGSIILEELPPS
jgi:hypothetical protein